YVSPIMPALGGNGLAMRAGMMLEALAADHDVWLLVVPVAGGDGGRPPRAIRDWCAGPASLRLDDGARHPHHAARGARACVSGRVHARGPRAHLPPPPPHPPRPRHSHA